MRVDRTAPTVDATSLPDPGVWQDQPQTIKLTGADEKSGLAAIQWQLNDEPAQTVPGDKTQLTITDDGRHTLTWETIDHAGNHSRTRQAVIRIDRSGPDTVQIDPSDPSNPRLVTATVSDQGSGINSGLIELRSHGGSWRQLDTTLNDKGTQLTAQLDDLALTDGQYQLRATATDNVGNSRSSSPAAITLPLRAASRITITSAPGSRVVRGRVHGEDGKPLTTARIAIGQRSRIAKNWKMTRTIRTNKRGRFTYRVPTGPTRTIRFTYTGTDTIRPANANQSVRTPARTTIRVSRRNARLGQAIRFSGRLTGGPIPKDGKVLELQAYDGGRWRSFPQVVTTGRDGRWSSTLRFERTKGTYTYRIRARVFRDGSYPYETGVSRTARVTVHGR